MAKGKKGFQPGESGNIKGRPIGTPNKSTSEIKNLVQQFVSANIETLQTDYGLLEPHQRLMFMERILKFIIPTREISEFDQMTDEQLDRIINGLKNKQ